MEKILIILAFITIYVVWGSTYLANEFGIDFIPPWLMAGSRFAIAGLILMGFSSFFQWEKPTFAHWKSSLILGTLFMTIGVGCTVWAQQFVDSGFTCLLVGMNPLIVMLLVWGLYNKRPNAKGIFGVVLGLVGMYLLVNQVQIVSDSKAILGTVTILACATCWAYGMVTLPKFDLPKSKMQSAGMQMFCGGILLLMISFFNQEYTSFHIDKVPWQSWLAVGYLIFFGSIAAFTAFNYLLSKVSPEQVSTSAYVNPVIAVFLGWSLRDELLTEQTLLASVVMLSGVYFINKSK
jgi:drug/metabolite transporter (DMT)-like permease